MIVVPLILVLPRFFGVKGLLYAGPLTDVISAGFAVVFLAFEIKDLNKKIAESEAASK